MDCKGRDLHYILVFWCACFKAQMPPNSVVTTHTRERSAARVVCAWKKQARKNGKSLTCFSFSLTVLVCEPREFYKLQCCHFLCLSLDSSVFCLLAAAAATEYIAVNSRHFLVCQSMTPLIVHVISAFEANM